MSPGGQSNLLLIRRLLHPSTPDFDPIQGRFFAQILPKFLPCSYCPALICCLLDVEFCQLVERRASTGLFLSHHNRPLQQLRIFSYDLEQLVVAQILTYHMLSIRAFVRPQRILRPRSGGTQ
jgi:hypothetical protein